MAASGPFGTKIQNLRFVILKRVVGQFPAKKNLLKFFFGSGLQKCLFFLFLGGQIYFRKLSFFSGSGLRANFCHYGWQFWSTFSFALLKKISDLDLENFSDFFFFFKLPESDYVKKSAETLQAC